MTSFEMLMPCRLRAEVAGMELFALETFLAVAQERSFSRAATRLRRTQPAVSQTIAKLEAELGETLLERSARDGSLTDAGEVLQEYAQKLLNLRTEATRRWGSCGRCTAAGSRWRRTSTPVLRCCRCLTCSAGKSAHQGRGAAVVGKPHSGRGAGAFGGDRNP